MPCEAVCEMRLCALGTGFSGYLGASWQLVNGTQDGPRDDDVGQGANGVSAQGFNLPPLHHVASHQETEAR